MADAVVGVKQAETPDRYIDNNVLTNDSAQTVYRQRVEDPEMMALIRQLLEGFNRMSTAWDSSGRMFVRLTDAAGTAQSVNAVQSGTWNIGTVTTVSTATTLTQLGGVAANTVPYGIMQTAGNVLRPGIVVT